jgi:hypothetical protein
MIIVSRAPAASIRSCSRDQIILIIHLDAVAGIEEEHHVSIADAPDKPIDGSLHVGQVCVQNNFSRKPRRFQSLVHGTRVIRWIAQWPFRIGFVTHDKRELLYR